MANVTVDSAAIINVGNRVCVRNDSNFVYVIVNAGGNLRMYKGNVAGEPASFAEQDAGNAPNNTDFNGCACAMESASSLISVIWYNFDSAAMQADPAVQIQDFDTSIDQWVGSPVNVAALTNSEGDFGFTQLLGIAIDSANDHHICWNDETAFMGSPRETIFYDNDSGGVFGGRILIFRQESNTGLLNAGMDIMIADPASSVNADRPIIVTNIAIFGAPINQINVYHGDALNAVSFTSVIEINVGRGSDATFKARISLAIDNAEKIIVTYDEIGTDNLLIIEHLNANPWTLAGWELPDPVIGFAIDVSEPSIAIDLDNVYIFLELRNTDDIALFKKVNGSYVEETADPDLPNIGTFNSVIVKWASPAGNNNSPRQLDYVFEDSTGAVLYNTFQGEAPPAATPDGEMVQIIA